MVPQPVGFERLQVILRTFCLRRTKSQQVGSPPRALVDLPPITVSVNKVRLAPSEQELYDAVYSHARCVPHTAALVIDTNLSEGLSRV